MNNLETVQSQLFDVKKIQLHSGLEGYDSPEMFGVYKSNGGKPLGVVGKVFEPMDLNLFMDSIVHSVEQCDINLDLNNLTFKEYKDGSKVSFELSLGKHEIETPMIGDIMETFMRFNTGFDGLTKTSVSYRTMRLWCLNGATSPMETQLSFKNTLKNHLKSAMLFCDEIWSTLKLIETNNTIGIKILEDNLMESLKEHFDTDDVKMGILPDLFAGSYGEDIVIVVDGMNYTIRIMETWIF